MKLTPSIPEHFEALVPLLGVRLPGEAILILCDGNSSTIFSGERPIGAAGVLPIRPGVGEAVAFFGHEIRSFPFGIHRAALRGLELFRAKHNYHRIQAHVELGFTRGAQWVERLGFLFEGTMRQYTSDRRTMLCYGKIWN